MKMGMKKGKPMMWSQWVWVRKSWVLTGPLGRSLFITCAASSRMPVPASITTRRPCSPKRSSRQAVLPPYFTVLGPGQGTEPRTPQKRRRILDTLPGHLQEHLGLFDLGLHRSLQALQVLPVARQVLHHPGGQLLRVAVPGKAQLVGVAKQDGHRPRET